MHMLQAHARYVTCFPIRLRGRPEGNRRACMRVHAFASWPFSAKTARAFSRPTRRRHRRQVASRLPRHQKTACPSVIWLLFVVLSVLVLVLVCLPFPESGAIAHHGWACLDDRVGGRWCPGTAGTGAVSRLGHDITLRKKPASADYCRQRMDFWANVDSEASPWSAKEMQVRH